MPSIEPAAVTDPLDAYLREVVVTLHAAVNKGYRSVRDNPEETKKVIQDCEEMLEVIMEGDVKQWVS